MRVLGKPYPKSKRRLSRAQLEIVEYLKARIAASAERATARTMGLRPPLGRPLGPQDHEVITALLLKAARSGDTKGQ